MKILAVSLAASVSFVATTSGFVSPSQSIGSPFLSFKYPRGLSKSFVKGRSPRHLHTTQNKNNEEVIPEWVKTLQKLTVITKEKPINGTIEDKAGSSPQLLSNDGKSLLDIINVQSLLYAASKSEQDDLLVDSKYTNSTKTIISREIPSSVEPSELKNWDTFLFSLQNRVSDILDTQNTTASSTTKLLDNLLQDTTLKIEVFLQDAATTMLNPVTGPDKSTSPDVFIQKLVKQITENEAATQAWDAAGYTREVLLNGWHSKDKSIFSDSVKAVERSDSLVKNAADMAALSGAIYLPETWQDVINGDLNHAIVANGTVEDVNFLVTDSVLDGKLVRTVTIRGFDASDDNVDREMLLEAIVIASPQKLNIGTNKPLYVHSGLLKIAEELYKEVMIHIDGLGNDHKVVLNGHSIGGSLSVLLMMIIARERGVTYVKTIIQKIYTFGAPPIASTILSPSTHVQQETCPILSSLSLPQDFIASFIQPWDPIARLFTKYDPLYPLFDDLGQDGVTLYSSGPQRTLRPIVRTILENWNKWPTLRPAFDYMKGPYIPIGTCYFLLPDTTRFLTDRLVNVFVEVPPLDVILEIEGCGAKTLDYLNEVFPLDEFRISFVPVALRSFVHHFFPAYSEPLVDFQNAVGRNELNGSDDVSLEETVKNDFSFWLEEQNSRIWNKPI